MKNNRLIDFKGAAGRMLRGNKVYGNGANKPNPKGKNQYSSGAAYARLMRKKQNG